MRQALGTAVFSGGRGSPAISHLLEKPFEKPGRAAAARIPPPHASASIGWKSMTF
jgi:hypothetical protein